MIWLSSTNDFSNHFSQPAGYSLGWPHPLKLEKWEIKDINVNYPKASSPTDAYQLKSKYLDFTSHTQELTSKEVSNEKFIRASFILSSGQLRGALDLLEYHNQNLSLQSMDYFRAGSRVARVMSVMPKQELGIQMRGL